MKKRLLLATVAYAAFALTSNAHAFNQILGDNGIDVDLFIENELIASGGVIDLADFNDISQVAINIANTIGTSGTGFNPVIVDGGVFVNQSIDTGSGGVNVDFTNVDLEAQNIIELGNDDPLRAGTLIVDNVSQIAANSLNVAGISYEGADASFGVSQVLDMQDGEDVYIEASNIITAITEQGSAFVGSDVADDPATLDIDESANEIQAALNRLNNFSLSSTTGEPTLTLKQIADLAYSESGGGLGSGAANAELFASNIIVAGSFIDGPIVTPPGQAPIIYDPSVLGTDQVAQVSINTAAIAATSGASIVDLADQEAGSGGGSVLDLPPGYTSGDYTGELGYDDRPSQYLDGFESGGGNRWGQIEVTNVIIATTNPDVGIDALYSGGGVDYTGSVPSGGSDGGIGDAVVGDLAQTGFISINTISAQGIEEADNVDLTLGFDEIFTVTTSGGTDTVVGYLGVDQVVEELEISEDIASAGGWAVNENNIIVYTENGDVSLYDVDQTRAVSLNTLSTDGALIGGFDTEQAADETEFEQSLDDIYIDVDNRADIESDTLGDASVDGLNQTIVLNLNSIRAAEFVELNFEQRATDLRLDDNDNSIDIDVDEGALNIADVSQVNSQSVNSATATDYEGLGFTGDTLNAGLSVTQVGTDIQFDTQNDFYANKGSGGGDITLDGLSQTGISSLNTLQGSFDTINVSQVAYDVNMPTENYASIGFADGNVNVDAITQTAINRINVITATPAPSVD